MLRLMLTTLLLAACTPVLAMYKCDSGGKLSYSDTPCADGKNVFIREALLPADATGTNARLLRDKTEANRLERERHQRESQDEKERLQAARAAARSHKKCDSLALRTKWQRKMLCMQLENLQQKSNAERDDQPRNTNWNAERNRELQNWPARIPEPPGQTRIT